MGNIRIDLHRSSYLRSAPLQTSSGDSRVQGFWGFWGLSLRFRAGGFRVGGLWGLWSLSLRFRA